MSTASRPVSTLPLWIPSGHALGPEAIALGTMFEEISKHMLESEALGASRRKSIEELGSLADECSSDDWDGHGARAIGEDSFREAERFLFLLPLTFPSPSISCEPDGEIEMEWYGGPRNVFSVSLGEGSMLKYAGISGRDETYGTLIFQDEIPDRLLDELWRVNRP